jgi:hypothetical protein
MPFSLLRTSSNKPQTDEIGVYVLELRPVAVWWSEFLPTDPEVSGSIPGITRFFSAVVGLERGPLGLVLIIELFQGNSGSGLENLD